MQEVAVTLVKDRCFDDTMQLGHERRLKKWVLLRDDVRLGDTLLGVARFALVFDIDFFAESFGISHDTLRHEHNRRKPLV
jgi:hypothetical protein